MGTFITYILYSQSKERYYIGSCEDINKRLQRHNAGLVRSTKFGTPWNIVYTESFLDRQSAYRREQQMKKYKGGQAFKALIHQT